MIRVSFAPTQVPRKPTGSLRSGSFGSGHRRNDEGEDRHAERRHRRQAALGEADEEGGQRDEEDEREGLGHGVSS